MCRAFFFFFANTTLREHMLWKNVMRSNLFRKGFCHLIAEKIIAFSRHIHSFPSLARNAVENSIQMEFNKVYLHQRTWWRCCPSISFTHMCLKSCTLLAKAQLVCFWFPIGFFPSVLQECTIFFFFFLVWPSNYTTGLSLQNFGLKMR